MEPWRATISTAQGRGVQVSVYGAENSCRLTDREYAQMLGQLRAALTDNPTLRQFSCIITSETDDPEGDRI